MTKAKKEKVETKVYITKTHNTHTDHSRPINLHQVEAYDSNGTCLTFEPNLSKNEAVASCHKLRQDYPRHVFTVSFSGPTSTGLQREASKALHAYKR